MLFSLASLIIIRYFIKKGKHRRSSKKKRKEKKENDAREKQFRILTRKFEETRECARWKRKISLSES